MKKILITSGCSFSECISKSIETWPKHLARLLPEYKHKSYAMGSQGNGLISRGIIYGVIRALETYKPEDILVGVMWSGSNRHDFRCFDTKNLNFVQDKVNNGWIENPTGFVEHSTKNWAILNINWTDSNKEAETYYRMFHDEIGASIYSIEHVLRTHWFLKSKGIKHFFTDFVDNNIVSEYNETHPDIQYLYEQIDRDYYLPVKSEFNWVINNTQYKHLFNQDDIKKGPVHPETEMHKEFVDQVIMPWLKDRSYI